jgi:glycolate oxidase iron-sulfur subunit
LEFVEMEDSSRCCGGAGTYSMLQRNLSSRLLRNKMERVTATSPNLVVTANPGCVMQLETGVRTQGLDAKVMHVVDVLDMAYRAEDRL